MTAQTSNEILQHTRWDRPWTDFQAMPTLGKLPERITIQVTRNDILDGIRASGNWCPIARAFRRALHEAGLTIANIDVDQLRAAVWTDPGFEKTEYWHDGAEFVHRFDMCSRVEPRLVRLEVLKK